MKKVIMLMVMMILCLSQNGQAAVIKIDLIGQVDYVYDTYNLLEGEIQPGDTITGYYIYDSETTDSDPSIYTGSYWQTTQPYGMYISIGSLTFQTDPLNTEFLIGVSNNYYGAQHDSYLATSYNNLELEDEITIDRIYFQLDDYSGTALSSDVLPDLPPDLTQWQGNSFAIRGGKYPFPSSTEKTLFQINGHITFVSPEPGTMLLFMMGTVALCRKNYKKY